MPTLLTQGGLRKQLVQSRLSGTSAASIYTPGTNKTAKVTLIVLCNTTGTAATFSIFHDTDGTTYDQTTALYYAQSLAANTTLLVILDTESAIHMNDSVGNIAFQQGTSQAITCTLYGIEETIGTNRGGS